jgi:ABC-type amino acid transport substrate-binding protein
MLRFIALVAFLFPLSAGAESLTFYVDGNPPFAFIRNGQVQGALVEAFSNLLRQENLQGNFLIFPARRGLLTVESESNSCALGVPYSGPNAEMINYVKPVAPMYIAAIARVSDAVSIRSLGDLNKYRVAISDISETRMLLKEASAKYKVLSPGSQSFDMLIADRFDVLIANSALIGARKLAGHVKVVFDLPRTDLWLACNRSLPVSTMVRLRDMLKEGALGASNQSIWASYDLADYYARAREDWFMSSGKNSTTH